MKGILLKFILVLSSKWLEYRFNRDYGSYFFDYSLNGRYGENGGLSGHSTVKSTDRGIYFQSSNSHLKIHNLDYMPSTFSASAWLITPDSYFTVFYSMSGSSGFSFGRYRAGDSFRLYINSGDNTGNDGCFPYGNIHLDNWVLLTLVFSANVFKGYINGQVCLTVSNAYSQSGAYDAGFGPKQGWQVLPCFLWNFVILNEVINFSSFINTSGSSNCLLGDSSCSSCTCAFKDPNLGEGCLSTNSDSSKNSFGVSCTTGSCTKTVTLTCSSANTFCSYNQTSHKCFTKAVSSSITNEPDTEVTCTCETPYVLRSGQCCSNICQTCNHLACTSCYASNAAYSSGSCFCNQGYYSKGNFENSDNCASCGTGCSSCSSTICSTCTDSNSYISGLNCLCKVKYYGTAPNCQSCRSGCEVCTGYNSCSSCSNSKSEIKDGICTCSEGYFGDGVTCTQCNPSCSQCLSASNCVECKVSNASAVDGDCYCDLGFFGDSSISCSACDLTCMNCSSMTECFECKDPNGVIEGGTCNCLEGFFMDDELNCILCGVGCSNCTEIENCFECYDSHSVVNGGSCVCEDGYFGNLTIENCTKCSFGCAKCNENQCEECLDTNSFPLQHECFCRIGFFMNQGSFECFPCEFGCLNCSSSKCFECISENTEIYQNFCYCKEGFWLNGSLDEVQACSACHSDCKSCIESQKCLSCKSNFALPDQIGCKCLTGYWNNSQLNHLKSCKACHEDCEVCEDEKRCIKCKNGDLNSEKQCVNLCWKNQTNFKGLCQNCPSLCKECNEDFFCTACIVNSVLDDHQCYCEKGYRDENSFCIDQFFHANLTVLKTNRVVLIFNESLEKNLSLSQLIVLFENSTIKVSFYEKNLTHFILNPKIELFSGNKREIILTIKTKIFSKYKARLSQYTFKGYLNPLAESEEASIIGIDTGTFVKIGVSASIGSSMVSNPTALWSLLSTIQLIIFMPLNSVPYPEKMKKVSYSFIEYNLIPNLFAFIFSPNCTSTPYENAYKYGIKSSVLLINTGPMFTLLVISTFLLIIFLLITRLPIKSEKITFMKSKYRYNLLLRFWIQSYLEFGLFSIIQLKSTILKFSCGFTNKCLSIIFGALFVFSPFFFFVIMKINQTKFENPSFKIKLGTLINEFKNDKGFMSTLYYPLYLLRRLEYILVQVFLVDFPFAQVSLNSASSLIVLGFLLYYRPLKDTTSFIAIVSSEMCVSIVFISSGYFVLFKDEKGINYAESLSIYTIFAAICVQLLISIYNLIKQLGYLYRKLEKVRSLVFVQRAAEIDSTQNISVSREYAEQRSA